LLRLLIFVAETTGIFAENAGIFVETAAQHLWKLLLSLLRGGEEEGKGNNTPVIKVNPVRTIPGSAASLFTSPLNPPPPLSPPSSDLDLDIVTVK
jgi:hypothetical protein